MEQVWLAAAMWLVLALVATLLSIWLKMSTALSEIVVGTVAQLLIGAFVGTQALGANASWISFLAGRLLLLGLESFNISIDDLVGELLRHIELSHTLDSVVSR